MASAGPENCDSVPNASTKEEDTASQPASGSGTSDDTDSFSNFYEEVSMRLCLIKRRRKSASRLLV